MSESSWSQDVTTFLDGLPENRRADARTLTRMMEQASRATPRLWGSMVGFGERHYRYESGREGDTFLIGFASRKEALVLYLGETVSSLDRELAALGPHRMGKGCVYVKRLDDVNNKALVRLLKLAART